MEAISDVPATTPEERHDVAMSGLGWPQERVAEMKAWIIRATAIGYSLARCRRALQLGDPKMIRKWLTADPAFADAYADAEMELRENMQDEAYRRAFQGYEAGDGKIKYSDRMMELALKAEMPEKFSREATGGGRIVINIEQVERAEIVEGEVEEVVAELTDGG